MDYKNVDEFKEIVEGFMRYHNLVGIEMFFYNDKDISFRVAGEGILNPPGAPREGMQVWEGMQEYLEIRKFKLTNLKLGNANHVAHIL
jgi:hypothetical protein